MEKEAWKTRKEKLSRVLDTLQESRKHLNCNVYAGVGDVFTVVLIGMFALGCFFLDGLITAEELYQLKTQSVYAWYFYMLALVLLVRGLKIICGKDRTDEPRPSTLFRSAVYTFGVSISISSLHLCMSTQLLPAGMTELYGPTLTAVVAAYLISRCITRLFEAAVCECFEFADRRHVKKARQGKD